jgi:trehalose 6-phosphate phosphatase
MRHLFSDDGERALADAIALHPLLAFDFDGTRAPIVARPGDARVSAAIASSLERLGRIFPLAIVSGRGVDDLRDRLPFQPRYIVGSHGAENPWRSDANPPALLDPMRDRLAEHVQDLAHAGVTVEDKGRSIALHYRLARDRGLAHEVVDYFARTLQPGLSAFGGKMVMNIVAAGAPDKAEAVVRLLEHSGAKVAIFLGDDVNDEPVVARAAPGWLTVKVGRDDPASSAMYCLDAPAEIEGLLERMLSLAARGIDLAPPNAFERLPR